MTERKTKSTLSKKPDGINSFNCITITYRKTKVMIVLIRTTVPNDLIETLIYFLKKYIFTKPSIIHGITQIDIIKTGDNPLCRSNAATGIIASNDKLEKMHGYFNFAVAWTELTIGLVKPIIKL